MCLYESAVSRRSARRDKHFVCNISSFNVPFFLHHHAVIVPVYVSPPSGNSLSRRAEVTAAATINPTYILTTSLPAIFACMPDCLLVPECVNAHVCA